MRRQKLLPPPLKTIRDFGLPQNEVAVRLGITTTWLRIVALKPERADEVRIAELEAILEHLRAKRMIESALPKNGEGAR